METASKFPHYHLCYLCAEERGGSFPKGHVCTVMKGQCKYCHREGQILIPWVDFNWSKDKAIDTLAKQNRD